MPVHTLSRKLKPVQQRLVLLPYTRRYTATISRRFIPNDRRHTRNTFLSRYSLHCRVLFFFIATRTTARESLLRLSSIRRCTLHRGSNSILVSFINSYIRLTHRSPDGRARVERRLSTLRR